MKAPVFVKIERYDEVEETLGQIKAKIEETKDIIRKLNEIRLEEDKELKSWEDDIALVEDKISALEQSMSK